MKIVILFFIILSLYDCSDKKKGKEEKMSSNINADNSFVFKDSEGRSYEIKGITSEQFNEFKSNGKLLLREDLQKEFEVNGYQLSTGGIIIVEGEYYSLYPSEAILRMVLAKNKNGPYSSAILYGVNKFGKDFPKHVDELVISLLDDLGIPSTSVQQNELLGLVDDSLSRHRTSFFFDKHYLALIALVGHAVIQSKRQDAIWLMKLDRDNTTWNPFILINSDPIFFADYLRDEFFKADQKRPLTETFETILDIAKFGSVSD